MFSVLQLDNLSADLPQLLRLDLVLGQTAHCPLPVIIVIFIYYHHWHLVINELPAVVPVLACLQIGLQGTEKTGPE